MNFLDVISDEPTFIRCTVRNPETSNTKQITHTEYQLSPHPRDKAASKNLYSTALGASGTVRKPVLNQREIQNRLQRNSVKRGLTVIRALIRWRTLTESPQRPLPPSISAKLISRHKPRQASKISGAARGSWNPKFQCARGGRRTGWKTKTKSGRWFVRSLIKFSAAVERVPARAARGAAAGADNSPRTMTRQ